MPISSIHYRAEIGLFYNFLHSCFHYSANKKSCDLLLISQWLPSSSHLITFLLLLTVFPIISLCSLIIGKTDLCKVFRTSYIGLYFCVTLVQRLYKLIAHRKILTKFLLQYFFFLHVFLFLQHIRLYLIMSGDIETNPGPLNKQDLSLCHWNLNSICASHFVKVSLIEAYIAVHDFDIICLSETFLNPDVSSDEERLEQAMLPC